MLTKFKVKNFKGFKDELLLDLSSGNYSFNMDAINNGFVNQGIIYGHNGCGKSNLGLAIFDLVLHLTDKEKMYDKYLIYLNGDSDDSFATFEYTFTLIGKELVYYYTKSNSQTLLHEKLIIDNQVMLDYDFIKDSGYCNLKGTETLKINSIDNKLSLLKFIKNNANLEDNIINNVFISFMDYVDRMLLFYSLDENRYQGLKLGRDYLDDAIVGMGKTKDFERFLRKNDVNAILEPGEINGQKTIIVNYKNNSYPFNSIASQGTKSLELYYYWSLMFSNASFVFIDEFDAFYHYEVSENIVKTLLYMPDVQCLLTTHNTDLLSNDILRPDCYYILNDGVIKSIPNLTSKELRFVHNIQKLFKAGTFNE